MESLPGLEIAEALQQFLADAAFGVVVLDRDLEYRWANQAFVRMTGFPDVSGRRVGTTYPKLSDRITPVLQSVMDKGEPFEWVVHGGAEPEAGGGRSWRARYVPLRAADGEITGIAALLIDITHEARLERAQHVLDSLGARLSEIEDPEEIAAAVPRLLVPDFLDGAVLYVRDASGRYGLTSVRGDDEWQDIMEREYVVPTDRTHQAADPFIEEGKPLVLPTTAFAEWLDERDRGYLLTRAALTPSSAVFPLAHAGQPLGLLVALSREPDFFDDDNVTALVEAARIAAATIYFARLHDSVRAEQRRAELLQEFGFRCALATTQEDVCSAVLSVGGPVVGARTVGITLLRPDTDELRARIRDVAQDEYADYDTSIGSTALLAQATQRTEMLIVPTREEIDRCFPGSGLANSPYVKSACAIPLTTGRGVIGSIGFAFEAEAPLSDRQLRTVQLVADQAAAALDRVWLDEQHRGAILQFQASLLPESLPETDYAALAAQFRPAPEGIELGGDWYDAFVRPDGSLCLIVGDAAGKGMTAATTVGALRHIVRYFAYGSEDPGAALHAANEAFLLGKNLAPDIATVCLAFLDPSGAVRISLAGHLPPLHVGPTSASLLTRIVDPPLGLRSAPRRSYTAQLAPGDTIVLYTDGLIERRREPIDTSFARLVDSATALRSHAAQPNELVERLMQELAGDANDDVAMLAATRVM